MTLAMEDIAFSDWPGQPVDLSGSNPWLPAYGFQPPTALLDKEDFLGNPDADLFLHGSAAGGQHYAYLETILEETSDDLQSDSDISESRASPAGWLATDSESGSVIRIETFDDVDSGSEREIACPSKRRRQENLLNVSDDESNQSLSRSSSLIQFESLEKQCQDISTSSPSVFSNYSFDSLDHRKNGLSPDSLERSYDDAEPESDYYKCLKVDLPRRDKSRDSLLYNTTLFSGSDSSESTESESAETTKYDSSVNLKTWRSFDGLHGNNNNNNNNNNKKTSSENLSEDSGYSDYLCLVKNKSSSIPNIAMLLRNDKNERKIDYLEKYRLKNCNGFDAYDGDVFQNFTTTFGVSCQDLSALHYDCEKKANLIERFVSRRINGVASVALNIEKASEFVRPAKYNGQTSSEPDLLSNKTTLAVKTTQRPSFETVCVSSVPKDLNLAGDALRSKLNDASIAVKNWDLGDLGRVMDGEKQRSFKKRGDDDKRIFRKKSDDEKRFKKKNQDTVFIRLTKGSSSESEAEAANFKREGSYLEAMANMIDMSDDECNPCYRDKIKKSTIVEFDKKILKAISETSIQSIENSREKLDLMFVSTMTANRNVKSTPNLAICGDNEATKRNSMQEIPRKSSLVNRSTSTSGVSDEDKTLTPTKSFSGSTSSKGVHFCPVVSEVNWRDDSASTERESSYSLPSTPEIGKISPPLIRPEPRIAERIYTSEPELQTLAKSTPSSSVSQPDVSDVKRRNSRRDSDAIVVNYVAKDGVSYRHTHLGDVYKSPPTTATTTHVADFIEQEVNAAARPVRAMESSVAVPRDPKPPSKSGKFGGFFSRIASFRFTSGKSKPKKNVAQVKNKENATGQRLATKEDYIYIPLKDPVNNNDPSKKHQHQAETRAILDENGCVSAKPPLPKLPPRVVGASVKKRQEAVAHTDVRERRNIDSGDALPRPMEPMGLIETDLDTEVTIITSGAHVKTRSLMNLGAEAPPRSLAAPPHATRPHKSMEFLLDKQNLKVVEPPENELQKGERVMSEHQLRVQRSLQKLTVPSWYKPAEVPREGFLLKKPSIRESRWTGTGSKTTSLSSLGSNSQSPVVLSPTPQNQPFVRWSTSKLNSTASSPCASTRSSFDTRQPNGSISPSSLRSSFNYRQPYLGWRSQERLTRPRTPAERLANSLIHQNQQQPQESPEIQTSIKEVTSAIVHYVSGLKPDDGSARDHSYDSQETASQRSRSVSPRGSQKLCWLESSFVGTRPLDSPQTPMTLTESQSSTPVPSSSLRLDLQTHNDFSLLSMGETSRPSPGSTTLEDVLDSLLGLPSSTRAPSPSLQETVSANTSPIRENDSCPSEQFRRRSEGNEPTGCISSRRVSFHSTTPVLRCRYSRCGRVAVATSPEGQAFKNCHNCSYTYCSRACRRAHWEKHRKTCLFSRVGSLCRQVIAASKEKPETLHHLSVIARRGYLSHGLGAVKCFFPTPEAAEKFLTGGLENLGELTYICWKDLLPSEMGAQLYSELVKMCKNYNPDSKLVLYVSVCVVSEAPAVGAVKWERQLVSRCAKMRLSRDLHVPERDTETPETLILTSEPIRREPAQRYREISVSNIQRHLRQRGVSLRRHYPEVFQQLQTYADGDCEQFKAVTVYPRDAATGKTFMCIIMPESEPQNLEKVVQAGVRVRTVDVLKD